MASLQEYKTLQSTLQKFHLCSQYGFVINIGEALTEGWGGSDLRDIDGKYVPFKTSSKTVIVEQGFDGENKTYPYEVHVYIHQSRDKWVATRERVDGFNSLRARNNEYFESQEEAIKFVEENWF